MTKVVRYTLKCFNPGTNNVVTGVKSGEEFDLAVLVKDLRGDGEYFNTALNAEMPLVRGVFAAYLDILYNKVLTPIKLVPNKVFRVNFKFGPDYYNGKWAVDAADRIKNLGAFSGSFGLDTEERELVRVRMIATLPLNVRYGFQRFTPNFDFPTEAEKISFQTLVYGNPEYVNSGFIENSWLKPENLEGIPASLNILGA
jgi:hypothetical protein